ISPDLTTDDPNRQKQEESGGITPDNSTAENNCTIFTICESPLDNNIIWVGTDDGNVQVTSDGGKNWTKLNANMTGLPALAWVSSIDADNFDKNAAYITVDAHRNGDMKPYVFYTNDLGKTWSSIASESIKGYAHNIKQDLDNPDILFLGTEFGLYISMNKGKEWIQFKNKVPQVGIFEIQIHPREHDVILGTHGRGIIIIDDITPLRNLKPEMLDQEIVFLPNKPYQFPLGAIVQDFPGDQEFVGANPTNNALVTYYMSKRHVFGEMYLELYDSKGNFMKKLPAGNRKGINKVEINTRMEAPKVPISINILGEAISGPEIDPGTYTVKLVKGEKTFSTSLAISENPAYAHSAADKKLRSETLMKAYNMLEHLAYIDNRALEIHARCQGLKDSLTNKKASQLAADLYKKMESMHKEIVATQKGEGAIVGQVRLREKIGEIYGAVLGYKGSPNNSQVNALEIYKNEMDAIEARLNKHIESLKVINEACEKQKLSPIKVISKEEFMKE
ncbi:MAG: WD40/YVTN/BNR-like repeat-containing protein, partial [Chitinophagales bacterium]